MADPDPRLVDYAARCLVGGGGALYAQIRNDLGGLELYYGERHVLLTERDGWSLRTTVDEVREFQRAVGNRLNGLQAEARRYEDQLGRADARIGQILRIRLPHGYTVVQRAQRAVDFPPVPPRDQMAAELTWLNANLPLQMRMPPTQQAVERAESLLKSRLTPQQLAQYERGRSFEVTGSAGGRYRINHGDVYNITRLDVDEIICTVPEGHLCIGDTLLAQKIALETDEPGTLKIANHGWTGLPREAPDQADFWNAVHAVARHLGRAAADNFLRNAVPAIVRWAVAGLDALR